MIPVRSRSARSRLGRRDFLAGRARRSGGRNASGSSRSNPAGGTPKRPPTRWRVRRLLPTWSSLTPSTS